MKVLVVHPETGEQGVIINYRSGWDNPIQVNWEDGSTAMYPKNYLLVGGIS